MNLLEELDTEIARRAERVADDRIMRLDSRIADVLSADMRLNREEWSLLQSHIKALTDAVRPMIVEHTKSNLRGNALSNLLAAPK